MMIIEGNRNEEEATIDLTQTIQANQAHLIEGAGIGKLEKIKGVLIMVPIILTIQNKQITTRIIQKIIQISEICMIIYINKINN
jgi:hypothetical protein